MDFRALSTLALRISGVFILVNTISTVPRDFIGFITTNAGANNVLEYSLNQILLIHLFSVIIPSVISLFLVFLPSKITNVLISETETQLSQKADFELFQQALLSALGVYFIASACFDAAGIFARVRIFAAFVAKDEFMRNAMTQPIAPQDFGAIAYTLVQFIAGILLVIGNKGLSHKLAKLRGTCNQEA